MVAHPNVSFSEAMQELINNPNENLAKMIRLNAVFLGWASGQYESIEKGFMCLQD